MKRVVMAASIVCAVFFIVGCGAIGGSPSSAARKFFEAVAKNDVKAMEKVASPEVVQLIGMLGEKSEESLANFGKITGTTEEIDGDTATVTVTFENGEEEEVTLKKIDGKWKVIIEK
jgi:cytochrome oxidase Cu insertion factor (SCO1/SenC/PrrC family)